MIVSNASNPRAEPAAANRPGRPDARRLAARAAGPLAIRVATGLLVAACALPAFAQSGGAGRGPDLDLGEPSVLSQRGQRLRIALPFGSAPGERVSATRFEVVSVSAPDGWKAPDAQSITVSKSEHRNLVFLQSTDPIDAPELTLSVQVAGQADEPQRWNVVVPPARATMTPVSQVAAAGVPGRPSSKAKPRAVRRATASASR
jgi:hypothetical protein